jgi:hypothetical protein
MRLAVNLVSLNCPTVAMPSRESGRAGEVLPGT